MTYYQPIASNQSELKVKGSRFIADIFPIQSEAEALELIGAIRKREHSASHHCYAFSLGTGDRALFRMNDDGEPAGTAGKPIYSALCGANLVNTLAVVTRYFGGTKLGKGGLIRAYSGVVQEAIITLKVEKFIPMAELTCQAGFDEANLVYRVIENFKGEILEQTYTDQVKILFRISRDHAEKAAWEMYQSSNGHIKAEISTTPEADIP